MVVVLTDASVAQDSRTLSWTIPSLAVGDVVVVLAITWDNGYTLNVPSGTGLAFTQRVNGSGAGHTTSYIWSAVASSADSNVVVTSSVLAGGSSVHNGVLIVFPAAEGYSLAGTPNTKSTLFAGGATATDTLAGTAGNVGVVCLGDWTGSSGASRAWADTPIEDLYLSSGGNSTHYFARYTLTGASTTVGLTAPSAGSTFTLAAIEVQYSAPAPPTQDEGTMNASAMRAMTRGRF